MKISEAINLYCAEISTHSSRQEAQWLIANIIRKSPAYLLASAENELSVNEERGLCAAIERIKQGEPLAYIMGEWEFYGKSFALSPDVLIPRGDSEILVEWLLHQYAGKGREISFLEIGCGSGAIAVTIAINRPTWRISATDISVAALNITRHNAQRHRVKIHICVSDLFAGIPRGRKFDIVFANLPYIAKGELLSLPDIRDEPRLAVDGGMDGLKLIRRFYQEAKSHLKRNSCLLVEHGYTQALKARDIAAAEGYCRFRHIMDLGKHKRGLAVKYLG